MKKIEFEVDGRISAHWAYGDFYFDVPNSEIKILLPYSGEPPHGDSFHRIIINARTTRGFAWSGYLLWSPCGNFFTCDWLEGMGRHYENGIWVFSQELRATIIVEPRQLRYRIVLSPSRNELHEILDEHGQDRLWQTLLNTEDIKWEDFHSAPELPLISDSEMLFIKTPNLKKTDSRLSLKKIAIATLLAPLAAIPASVIFATITILGFTGSSGSIVHTIIFLSALSAMVSYIGLLIFGTLPMLIRRTTDGLNIGTILLAIVIAALIITFFTTGNLGLLFVLVLYSSSVALAFWFLLNTGNKCERRVKNKK